MSMDVSEKNFEEGIETTLTSDAKAGIAESPVPAPLTGYVSGGYFKRLPTDYDKALCLIPSDLIDFIYATQPKEWEKLKQQHGADAKNVLLKRIASEIQHRGTLEVLRKPVKANGCKFHLTYFRPTSGLNEAHQTLYHANLFSVIRQLKFSEKNEQSIDVVLFLNGLPIFTAELKNPFMQQN